jgi:hypothetical protein
MVLLGDEAQVEAHFGLFGDSANLDAILVYSLRWKYHRLENPFGRTWWNSSMMWVIWNLVLGHPEPETLVPLVYNDSLVRLDLEGVKLVNLAWIPDVVKSMEIGSILVLSSLSLYYSSFCVYYNVMATLILILFMFLIAMFIVYFDYMSSIVTLLLLSSCIWSYSVYPKVPRVDDLHYVGVVLRYIAYLRVLPDVLGCVVDHEVTIIAS